MNDVIRQRARETADRIAMYVSGSKWSKTGIRARVEDALRDLVRETNERAAQIAGKRTDIDPFGLIAKAIRKS